MAFLKRLGALAAALLFAAELAGCAASGARISVVSAPDPLLLSASSRLSAAEEDRSALAEELNLLEYNCKRLALYTENAEWEGAARFWRQTDRLWRILRYRRGADYPEQDLTALMDSIQQKDDVSSFQQALDLLEKIYSMELALKQAQ